MVVMESLEGLELLAEVASVVAVNDSFLNNSDTSVDIFMHKIPKKKRSCIRDNTDALVQRSCENSSPGDRYQFECKQEEAKLKKQKLELGFKGIQDLKMIKKDKPIWSLQVKSALCFRFVKAVQSY